MKVNGIQSDSFGSVANSNAEPIEATAAYCNDPWEYQLSRLPLFSSRPIKVIIAGAGASALSFAHEVQIGALKNIDLHILEKNAGLGGTWFENRYPGCACDIPSHAYLFTWAPNPKWSQFYVSAPEILEYFQDVAKKYDLEKYITCSRKVIGARWMHEKQKWQVSRKATDGRRTVVSTKGVTEGEMGEEIIEECDIFINASGFFNQWRWPKIPGRERFSGTIIHSADYDPGIDLRNKRVAVIGNGSSGIQLVAAIQPIAAELAVYMRNPTWVLGNFASKFTPDGKNLDFSDDQKAKWSANPEEYLQYRKAVETELNDGFPFFIRGTKHQAEAKNATSKEMNERLATRPELRDRIIPEYPVGCRRPTPGTGYLEALCADNTTTYWGELEEFTATGIRRADGSHQEFDIIICATGFDMSCVPRWPTIGINNTNLQDEWSKSPACYLSAIANDMPNYFVYMGPGAPVGYGSLLPSIERVTGFICDMIRKLQTQNYSSFILKPGKAKAWQCHQYAWNEKTVWGEKCVSSFKDGKAENKLYAFHPGSRLHYYELLRTHRYEDFEWTSISRDPKFEFAWLANGFLEGELEQDKVDKCWYMSHPTEVLTSFVPQSTTAG